MFTLLTMTRHLSRQSITQPRDASSTAHQLPCFQVSENFIGLWHEQNAIQAGLT